MLTTILLSSLGSIAMAKIIEVQVGDTGLDFNPNSITAAKGDVINFTIFPDHNVAQSTFSSPCQPSGDAAIYSGTNAKTFAVTVNNTDPLWFYCATPQHCSNGMVMAVNPP
jgi:plastocyanin